MESVDPVEIGGNARKFLTSPRLAELKKEFEQNGGKWKKFKIGELFDIHPTKAYKLTNADLLNTKGKTPVVSNTGLNNGIIGFSALPPTEQGNIITYSDTTTSDGIFYQPADFIGYPHIQGLYPHQKNKWFEKSQLYFVSLFRKSAAGRFDYANKFNRKTAAELTVTLPAAPDGTPDFSYMERYIGELEQARVSELAAYLRAAGLENYDLTAAEQTALDDFKNGKIRFKEFKITGENGIFSVKNTHSILKNQIIPNSGNYPYVTAGETNNSILTYISYDESFLEKGNSIMIAGKSMVITYQEKNYFSNDSHNLSLLLKIDSNKTYKHFLFLASALYKSLHNKYSWGDSISKEKIKKDHLWLPVIDDKNIDYNFMESFVAAQQKLAIRDVVLWKDKVISETRKVANV